MADATVGILRVLLTANSAEFETGIKKASDSTKKLGQDMTQTGRLVQDAGSALSRFVTVGAIAAFGKQLLDAADATVKLSDKTGIAIEPLQRLQYIAEQSGNSIDQVSSAVTQMQRRLADGDKSAVGAVNALGLSMQHLLTLSPDQQFMAIGREVAKIEDPMKRAQVAMALFGRSGAELLPTLISDMEGLANQAPVMSEKATKAFDAIGDAISRVYTGSKNLVGNGIGAMIDGFTRLGQSAAALATGDLTRVALILADEADVTIPKVTSAFDKFRKTTSDVSMSMSDMDDIGRKLTEGIAEQTKKTAEQTKKAEEFRRAQDQLFGRDVIQRANEYMSQLGSLSNISRLTTDKKKELREAVQKALDVYQSLGERAPKQLQAVLDATTPLIEANNRLAANFVPLKDRVDDAGDALHDLASSSLAEAGQATKEADEAMRLWAMTTGGVLMPALRDNRAQVEASTEKTKGFASSVRDIAKSFETLATVAGDSLGDVFRTVGTLISQFDLAQRSGEEFGESLANIRSENKNLGNDLPRIAAGIATLGASFVNIVQTASGASAAMQGFVSAAGFASAAGASGMGAIGAGLIGGVAAWAIGEYKEMKRLSEIRTLLIRQIPKLVEEINKLVPASANVSRAAQAMGLDLQAALMVGGPEQKVQAMLEFMSEFKHRIQLTNDAFRPLIQSAIEMGAVISPELQRMIQQLVDMGVIVGDNASAFASLVDRGEVDWKKMQDAAEKYGIELSGLGDKFEAQRFNDAAAAIWNDFRMLQEGGADVGAVLVGMKDEIINLAAQALNFGQKIPDNFKPLIRSLLESNQLTVDERNALEGLDDADFGPGIVSQFDTLIAKIDELISSLLGPSGVNPALIDARNHGQAVGGTLVREFGAATTAAYDLADAVREVVEMRSPTGLEGIIHYAGMAKSALLGMSSAGMQAVDRLASRVSGVVESVSMPSLSAGGVVTAPTVPSMNGYDASGISMGRTNSIAGMADDRLRQEVSGLRREMQQFTRVLPIVMRDALRGAV